MEVNEELQMSDLELLTVGNENRAQDLGINKENYLHLLKTMKKEDVQNASDFKVDFNA